MRPNKCLQSVPWGEQMLLSIVCEASLDLSYYEKAPFCMTLHTCRTIFQRSWAMGVLCKICRYKVCRPLQQPPGLASLLHSQSSPPGQILAISISSRSSFACPRSPVVVIIIQCNALSWRCKFSHRGHPWETCLTELPGLALLQGRNYSTEGGCAEKEDRRPLRKWEDGNSFWWISAFSCSIFFLSEADDYFQCRIALFMPFSPNES